MSKIRRHSEALRVVKLDIIRLSQRAVGNCFGLKNFSFLKYFIRRLSKVHWTILISVYKKIAQAGA